MCRKSALTRLPKTLALLGALLLAVFTVGASTASAHGNHAQQVSIRSSDSVVFSQSAEIRQSTHGHVVAASADAQNELPDPHSKSDCCCGSVMCHSGVTLAAELFPFLCPTGARLVPEPVSGRPQSDSAGLERPPRSLDIA